MSNLICPSCRGEMATRQDADISTEVCKECGGVFLDKGELNTLATGMKGNIEYCTVDRDYHADVFPVRSCPKCADVEMTKVNLLRLSDVILDYCPQCHGFYLDRGEVAQMNDLLRKLNPSKKSEEYRGEHNGHLVRVDQASDVIPAELLGVSVAQNAAYIRISVFFKNDLPAGFRLFHEAWPLRFAKHIGLFWGQDIITGDEAFDEEFRVKGHNVGEITAHLDADTRAAMLAFVQAESSVSGKPGTLEVTSTGLAYVEGPYIPDTMGDVVGKCTPMIDQLVAIAGSIEATE